MASIGLGSEWQCLFANDFDKKKEWAYRVNFPPAEEFRGGDVFDLTIDDLPDDAMMAWASFPCQDLSLAGNGRGLRGKRSGSFWGFWHLIHEFADAGRPVPIIVLENVTGLITANKGEDFRILLEALVSKGYLAGALAINAMHFVPQSRPRLFIVAVHSECTIPTSLTQPWPSVLWHSKSLQRAYGILSAELRASWIWWRMPAPSPNESHLIDFLEEEPTGVEWHTPEQTQRLLDMMSDKHLQMVHEAQATSNRSVGTIFKRIRRDKEGQKVQRAELRMDGVSGCLRTALGGSSRQIVMVIEGKNIRSRLLSPREGARLMGLPDSYILPDKYNEAYNLIGDGLAVPVIAWIEEHLLTPLAQNTSPPESSSISYLDFAPVHSSVTAT